jgi:chromatin remodeling complex protein RSC6
VYSAKEAIDILWQYARANDLDTASDKRLVCLDEVLARVLLPARERNAAKRESVIPTMAKKDFVLK